MADFESAYKNKIVPYEGGYDTDPDDGGNWSSGKVGQGYITGTNAGIIATDFKTYFGYTPTADEMKNLSEASRKKIWKALYWDKMQGDEIKDQRKAEMIFDVYVNMGYAAAIRLTQDSLQIARTGAFDTNTINSLNSLA